MFEQVCLACGKHLAQDDRRAYCSDLCETGDAYSPSLSSASSAFSSPHLGLHDAENDVPALVLNSALARSDFYASSASASSTCFTDDEVCDEISGYISDDAVIIEPHSKPVNFMPPHHPSSAMGYARRPSGVNNPGKSRNPMERSISSGSYSALVGGAPRSAPIQSHLHYPSTSSEDEGLSDYPRDERSAVKPSPPRPKYSKRNSSVTKSKRSHNRTSLPAYFSLLALGEGRPSSPELSLVSLNSSSNTIARISPPTPKVGSSTPSVQAVTASTSFGATYSTPRGRRKVVDRSERTDSESSSRERSLTNGPTSRRAKTAAVPSQSSVEQLFDWPSANGLRGGHEVRRNSSPPPKMLTTGPPDLGRSRADFIERRGRYRVQDMQVPASCEAPGLGLGRSGILGRRPGCGEALLR